MIERCHFFTTGCESRGGFFYISLTTLNFKMMLSSIPNIYGMDQKILELSLTLVDILESLKILKEHLHISNTVDSG